MLAHCVTDMEVDLYSVLQMDVWALGVCIYCWIFGRLPFVGQTILETFEAIKQNELQFDIDVECSEELRDLLVKVRFGILCTISTWHLSMPSAWICKLARAVPPCY